MENLLCTGFDASAHLYNETTAHENRSLAAQEKNVDCGELERARVHRLCVVCPSRARRLPARWRPWLLGEGAAEVGMCAIRSDVCMVHGRHTNTFAVSASCLVIA